MASTHPSTHERTRNLGRCALLLAAGLAALTVPSLAEGPSKAPPPGVTPPTQAQIEQMEARNQQEMRQALPRHTQRVDGILAQQRQRLEQARQASLAEQRASVAQMRALHHAKPPSSPSPQADTDPFRKGLGNKPAGAATAAGPATLQLDRTTVARGGPETAVGFFGSGFTPGCEVHFRIAESRDLAVRPDWVEGSTLSATLPASLTGLQHYDGAVYIKREDGQTTASKPFYFIPRMEVAKVDPHWLEPSPEVLTQHPGAMGSFNGFSIGYGSCFLPVSGTDSIGTGRRLKNGWLVDHYEFDCGQGQLMFLDTHPGFPDVSFKLKWSTLPVVYPFFRVGAYFSVIVQGPAGLPYK